MKKIEINKATLSLAEYARQVAEEPIVVLRSGKPIAVLSSAKGMDLESISLSHNPKFAAIIRESRESLAAHGGISIDEVRRRLGISEPLGKSATARTSRRRDQRTR